MSEDHTLVSLTRHCPLCKKAFGTNVAICPADGTLLMPIKADEMVGTIFADKYRITDELGRGGMSIVYRGVHELMKRTVAVKVMQRELSSNPISVRRFQQEAEAASRLAHPHVITVYDFGVTPHAQPYLVMDLVTGINFAELLKESKHLEPARALKIFRQICEALDHAHQRGVVHRDLKPSNVMLVDSEEDPDFVKVLDFGIAKVMAANGEEKRNLTTSGEIFGSPLYMSPEQCRGADSDARTDVYSVGVMLYEALTGFPPIRGASYIETIQMQISTPPQPFDSVLPGAKIPAVLETIAFKAMAKKPEDRYQSMKEFSSALQNAGRTLGLASINDTAPVQVVVVKKSPVAIVLSILGAIGICGLLVLAMRSQPSQPAVAADSVTGTVYYYAPDANPGVLVVYPESMPYKILTGDARLEHAANAPHGNIFNGGNWTVSYHRDGKNLYLDEKGTKYNDSIDPDLLAVDKLIRKHYSNLANGEFDEALKDFSDKFVQKFSQQKLKESWKNWHGLKGCENAPDSAIEIYAKTRDQINARVDGSKFVRGETYDYLITFWKEGETWKLQSLTTEKKPTVEDKKSL